MKLNFKVPTFYKTRYGTDNEIDYFCELIGKLVSTKNYSLKVDTVNFIPIIVSKEMLKKGLGKEFTKIDLAYKLVALGRQVDFQIYYHADINEKKKLLLNCLISGIDEVKDRIKFDINKFREDIEFI